MRNSPENYTTRSVETTSNELSAKTIQSFLQAALEATALYTKIKSEDHRLYLLQKILEYLLTPITTYILEMAPGKNLEYRRLKSKIESDILELQRELEYCEPEQPEKPVFTRNSLPGTFTAICLSIVLQVHAGRQLSIDELQQRAKVSGKLRPDSEKPPRARRSGSRR